MRASSLFTAISIVLAGACADVPTIPEDAAPPTAPLLSLSLSPGLSLSPSLSAQTVGCSAPELIDALNGANLAGGATLFLAAGCTYALTAVNNYSAEFGINGLPLVTGAITINGNGAVIKRDSTAPDFRVWYVRNTGEAEGSGNLTLNDVTISGGKYSNPGGGLVNDGGIVTINRSTISGNEAGDAGGGLVNLGGTLTLNHSSVLGNEAGDVGGGVSTIGGTLSLNHTTVSGNLTSDAGGGLSAVGGTVTLNHSTVTNNDAGDAGGGVFNDGATLNVINSSTISANHTGDNGGGLRNFGGGHLTLDNSTVSGNSADDDGGGLSNDGGIVSIINHSTVSGNEAGDDGGGVANVAGGSLTIRNSTLRDNEAGETGGALYNYDAAAVVTAATASGNRAKWGGALFSETVEVGDPEAGATLTVVNSTISGNHATEAGGGIFNYKGGQLVVVASTITGNDAGTKPGGGVLSYNDVNGRADIKAAIVAGNSPDDVAAIEDKTRFNSLGHNLVGTAGPFVSPGDFDATGDVTGVVNPGLAPLQDNGGPTFTRALLAGSPAIDAIPAPCGDHDGIAVTQDQRGADRSGGSACDIGAFEVASSVLVPQAITFDQPPSPQPYGVTFTVNATAGSGLPVSLAAAGVCTVNGSDVTVISGSGDCVLTASQGGDAADAPAADVGRIVRAQRAELTVIVQDETVIEGASPSFHVGYSGLVPRDDAGSLGGALTLSFSGTAYGPSPAEPVAPGTYSVTPGGLTSDKYSISFDAGDLTITPVEIFGNAANGNAATLTIARLAGVQAGDFLLAQITFQKGSDAGGNAQITPSGWTLVRRTNRGTDLGQAVFYRFATAAEPAWYTWTFSQSLIASGGILRFTGINTSTPIVASSGGSGDSNTLTAPGVNAPANSVLVGFYALKKKSTSLSTPAGMAERYYFESSQDLALRGADETRATAGATGSRVAIAGHAEKWIAQLVALRAN